MGARGGGGGGGLQYSDWAHLGIIIYMSNIEAI